jgi:hypothetical protein
MSELLLIEARRDKTAVKQKRQERAKRAKRSLFALFALSCSFCFTAVLSRKAGCV